MQPGGSDLQRSRPPTTLATGLHAENARPEKGLGALPQGMAPPQSQNHHRRQRLGGQHSMEDVPPGVANRGATP
eukprot:85330-Alexandrium_andersonii.AAC.1